MEQLPPIPESLKSTPLNFHDNGLIASWKRSTRDYSFIFPFIILFSPLSSLHFTSLFLVLAAYIFLFASAANFHSELGIEILTKRYLRKDESGNPTETISELFWRVAAAVARSELNAKVFFSFSPFSFLFPSAFNLNNRTPFSSGQSQARRGVLQDDLL